MIPEFKFKENIISIVFEILGFIIAFICGVYALQHIITDNYVIDCFLTLLFVVLFGIICSFISQIFSTKIKFIYNFMSVMENQLKNSNTIEDLNTLKETINYNKKINNIVFPNRLNFILEIVDVKIELINKLKNDL